jgi:hypothetical protein
MLALNGQSIEERYRAYWIGQTSVITAWNSSRCESFGHFFLQAQLRCELRFPDTLDLIDLLDSDSQTPRFLSAGRAYSHVYDVRVHAVSRLSRS